MPEYNVSSQDTAPNSGPPKQNYSPADHEAGAQLESTVWSQEVLMSEPREPEHLFPRSQGGQVPSTAMPVHRVANNDERRAVLPPPGDLDFRRINEITVESLLTFRSSGRRQEPRRNPTRTGTTDSRQAQHPESDRVLESSNEESSTAQALAIPPPPGPWFPDGQRSPGAQEGCFARSLLDQTHPKDSPGTIGDLTSYEGPPSRHSDGSTATLIGTPDSQETQDLRSPPSQQTDPLTVAQSHSPAQFDPWHSRPRNRWIGILPDPSYTWSADRYIEVGQKRRRVTGPTQPLGPPMKPFDGKKFEDEAQWNMGVSMQERMREARG